MTRYLCTATLCLTVTAALPALAEAPSLAQRHRAVLVEIARAKHADPAVFKTLSSLRAGMPELDRKKRGRLAAVTPRLRALGSRALLPMLEALAYKTPAAWTETARLAWRIGLLEAVSALRDPRATPVLHLVLTRESEPRIISAAASALGNLGDEESVKILTPLAAARGPRQLAVIAGMGTCRRLAAARALTQLLSGRPSEEMAGALAKALGELGSAWAWETPRLAALGEGSAVRGLAASALLDAFLHYEGSVRKAAETAILLVDAPDMRELLARARRSAPAGLQSELGRLERRLAHSPVRPAAAR